MKIIKLNQTAWQQGLEKLKAAYGLFAPVKTGAAHEFKPLGPGQAADLDFQNTRLSPKGLIYPQTQVMFHYDLNPDQADHHQLHEAPMTDGPRALIGIRPCDADAFLLVRRNFDTPQYKDPYWIKAYEATTLVGLACTAPCATCFCTTAGSGPFSETGLDVLLVPEADGYTAKLISPKGEALAAAAGWDKAPAGDAGPLADKEKAARARITATVATDQLKAKATLDLYDAPFWDDVAFACINCGTCTYLCPTCWCFDIQDETRGKSGVRLRNWDSCMYPLFSLHGTGHNPRGLKIQRVRQRFMHKLKYYVDKYDDGIQCVGCGRCVQYCPVNIDIRKVCNLMNAYGPAPEACKIG